MLNLSDVTSKFRIVTLFLIFGAQTRSYIMFSYVFMRHIIVKFHVFSSNGLFFTTIGPTRNKNFFARLPSYFTFKIRFYRH